MGHDRTTRGSRITARVGRFAARTGKGAAIAAVTTGGLYLLGAVVMFAPGVLEFIAERIVRRRQVRTQFFGI